MIKKLPINYLKRQKKFIFATLKIRGMKVPLFLISYIGNNKK